MSKRRKRSGKDGTLRRRAAQALLAEELGPPGMFLAWDPWVAREASR